MPNLVDRYRKAELAKIHVAKKQLALDDETYRALLERVTGQSSAADLTARQRDALLKEFARLGFRAPNHRQPNPAPACPTTIPGWGKGRLIAKIGALLCDADPPRPWAYADGMARKMFRIESIRFCNETQLHKIVAALMYDQKRRTAKTPPAPDAA